MVAAASALVAALVVAPAVALASGLQPLDLRVDGGEESWRAEPGFAVRWSNPDSDPPVAAVHYRLLDPGGTTLAERRIGWAATSIQPLTVPAVSGAYRAEVWLEDAMGGLGDPVGVPLRFDDAAPGRVEPEPVGGWISRNAFPLTVRLGPAEGAEPLAGIRGYATSIDRFSDGSPCADAFACAEAETDLLGAASRTLTVGALPEGTSYVHAVAVSGSGMRSREVGSTALHVDETDPTTTLGGLPDGWSNRPLQLTATAVDDASGMAAAGPSGPFTAIRIDGGAPVVADGDSASATVIESGAHTVAYYARDAAGNVDDGGTINGHRNREPRLAVARVDREPPRLAFANSQDPGDPERIEALATDGLSGVDPSRGTIAVRPLGSGGPFVALPTESLDGVLRARWDSAACPPGEYELRAVAYDRAGNSTATTTRSNGSPMRLEAPLKTETTLSAGFAGGSTRIEVPYGRRVAVRGRLIAGRRTPLAGTPVAVVERFAEGTAAARRVSEVETGPDGRFDLLLRPGATREVVAVVAATRTLRGASSGPLRVGVRTGVRLGVSARVARIGGRPIVFGGRVLGGPTVVGAGVPVQLQFRLPGLPWSEFRTVRTNRRGRFRYAYRFADDDSRGATFQFRAFVPAQAGWPFEPAGSTPVTVRGV